MAGGAAEPVSTETGNEGGIDIPAQSLESDEELRTELVRRVRADVLSGRDVAGLVCHEWEILDFSSCLSIEWLDRGARAGVYVKVPKSDRRRRSVRAETAADRALAEEEFKSLLCLQRDWNGLGPEATFVKPLAFYREHNAIVTERAYGNELLWMLRRDDLLARSRRRSTADRSNAALERVGWSLRSFHRRSREAEGCGDGTFRALELIRKSEAIVDDLRVFRVSRGVLRRVLEPVARYETYSCSSTRVLTLKGLDVRNMLIGEGDRIYLLDPGKMKLDVGAADLARVLVTCRILYWGSLWLFPRLRPAAGQEQALIKGYYGETRGEEELLRLHIVKELLRQWRDAHAALTLKPWPRSLKWLLRKTYIDPFYTGELLTEVGLLSPA